MKQRRILANTLVHADNGIFRSEWSGCHVPIQRNQVDPLDLDYIALFQF
jgi:hypothetical protein